MPNRAKCTPIFLGGRPMATVHRLDCVSQVCLTVLDRGRNCCALGRTIEHRRPGALVWAAIAMRIIVAAHMPANAAPARPFATFALLEHRARVHVCGRILARKIWYR